MKPEQAYETMQSRMEGLDRSMVRSPTYKVEDRIVEAQRLYKEADARGAMFEKLSEIDLFDMDNVNRLERMALALRHAESNWTILRNPTRSSDFVQKMETLEEMRKGLLRDLDYVASRFQPEGLERTLGLVREGQSREDLLQDVETLATLARNNLSYLEKIGFEKGTAEQASRLASELGGMLNVDKDDMEKAKNMRDRASTVLESMMSEVRSAANFLFRHEPETLSDFRDHSL